MTAVWKKTLSVDFLKKVSLSNVGVNMVGNLGIEFTAFGSDWLEAIMPVNANTIQPFGILHGGASVVLAETLGSYASYLVIGDFKKICVGVDVSATHLRSVKQGSSVIGRASAVKLGRRLHVWDIKIHEIGNEIAGPTCVSRLSVMISENPRPAKSA